ncbi:UNVERIFIED_CONTAM: hypothetical protein K2H54_065104 [Gekko kuhli]
MKVCGKSWTRAEVLDLLALWGDQKIQAALSEGTKNIEIFEEVAAGMAARGHNKTAHEWSESQSTTQPPSSDSEDSALVGRPIGDAGTPETPGDDGREAEEPMENHDRDPDQLPPDVYMADLTAGERAALTKARKKRCGSTLFGQDWPTRATKTKKQHRVYQLADQRQGLTGPSSGPCHPSHPSSPPSGAMLQSDTHVAPRHPATNGARLLKPLGPPSPSATAGTQLTSHLDPSHPVTSYRPPLHGVQDPSGPPSGGKLQRYTHAAPRHPATTGGARLRKPLGPHIPSATGGPQFSSHLDPSHLATSDRPRCLTSICNTARPQGCRQLGPAHPCTAVLAQCGVQLGHGHPSGTAQPSLYRTTRDCIRGHKSRALRRQARGYTGQVTTAARSDHGNPGHPVPGRAARLRCCHTTAHSGHACPNVTRLQGAMALRWSWKGSQED